VILELKVPKTEVDQIQLHISKVAFGLSITSVSRNNTDSVNIGHFNASSPCNINVICPQGNAWQTEQKSVCLIQVEDGADGSGALINNTCNALIPYVLTAWHIQNGRNPSNWTFLFGWWSSTCTPNTNTNQSILFNGATLVSTYEPSDFCLIKLNQTPSSNLNLSFLGWNKQNITPTSTTGIHHPEGDQMKICFDTSPPTIGNIDAYTNTAWRTVWKSGTTEPGSSGSPLFDQNHRVVGQDYSGTQPTYPPCDQQTGGNNYGRFDISWTGGGTSATRLSDWLDPSNSGAATTNKVAIANMGNVSNLVISGPANFCSSGQYSINTTLPVTWSASPSGYVNLVPNGSSVTVTPIYANAVVTLSATIACPSTVISKQITIYPLQITITSTPSGSCNGLIQTYLVAASPSNGGTNWLWSVGTLTGGSTIYIYTPNAYSTYVDVKGGGPLNLSYTDLCGNPRTSGITVYSTCHAPMFIVSPNPATGDITVSSNSAQAQVQSTEASAQTTQTKIYQIKVLNQAGTLLKQFSYPSGVASASLHLGSLMNGTYTLQIYDNVSWTSQQLVIMK
jgi:hypothetical protein